MGCCRERWLARKRANALSEIQDDKAFFEESVIAAKAAGSSFSAELVANVSVRFQELEDRITRATSKSQIETLSAQSATVVQLRAYVAPAVVSLLVWKMRTQLPVFISAGIRGGA